VTSEAALTPLPTATLPVTLTVRVREPVTATPLPPRPALTAAPTQPPAVAAALVYAVRPGDTLLGIALDFGLALEALQAANASVDPRSLQVGQQLIIPPPTLAAPPLPLPLPLEPPTCYDTASGALLCLGRVTNAGAQPVEHVQVQVQLWQADGTPLAAAETSAEQAVILPGGAAPYSVLITSIAADPAYATAVLLSADPAPQTDRRFVALVIEDAQASRVDGRYAVTATLYNPSADAAGPARVVLTLLDADGRVTGYRIAITPGGIAPGARVTVAIEAAAQDATRTASHTLYAEARRADS
jgi:LysM repeat protein